MRIFEKNLEITREGIVIKETPKGFKTSYPITGDEIIDETNKGISMELLIDYSIGYMSGELE